VYMVSHIAGCQQGSFLFTTPFRHKQVREQGGMGWWRCGADDMGRKGQKWGQRLMQCTWLGHSRLSR
jgi:hypothetical protein